MPKTDPLIPRDMAKAILRYEADATKILQAFIHTVEAQKPPALLYHYTNDAGLAGIIESGQLRFSDIFALNDPSELRHGLSFAIDILKSRATPARPEIATFASMFRRCSPKKFRLCCSKARSDPAATAARRRPAS
jgi:hypothetical protein